MSDGRRALRLRRWWARRRGGVAAPLRACWDAPLPGLRTPLARVDFLVCDAEMSGLDARAAEILSLAWVGVSAGEIRLDSAARHLLRPLAGVGDSATIHRLRDCDLQAAAPLPQVLERFLEAAAGRVLVFHHAALDLAFLDRAARGHLGAPLLLPAVDTLELERRQRARRNQPLEAGALRLSSCRQRYGLPAYAAHDALGDALATAELLLAQIAARAGGRLGDVS